jgi:hypothetical protein
MPTVFYDRNNTNLAQHSKVLGSGGLRNFHATDDFADSPVLAIVQESDHLSSLRFRDSVEEVGCCRCPGHGIT